MTKLRKLQAELEDIEKSIEGERCYRAYKKGVRPKKAIRASDARMAELEQRKAIVLNAIGIYEHEQLVPSPK